MKELLKVFFTSTHLVHTLTPTQLFVAGGEFTDEIMAVDKTQSTHQFT